MLLASLLHIASFSTIADFSSDSCGPAAAVIPDVNGVPAVAGLAACYCWHQYF
jgi:hypothetical protein